MSMGKRAGDRVRVTQANNGDYSDLIRTKRLFCGFTSAELPPSRSNVVNLWPLLPGLVLICATEALSGPVRIWPVPSPRNARAAAAKRAVRAPAGRRRRKWRRTRPSGRRRNEARSRRQIGPAEGSQRGQERIL